MSAKTKTLAAQVLLAILVITLGACTAKAKLPVLREAPDFGLINQDGREVRLSDFRGKVVIMDFIYTTCPDACGVLNHNLKAIRDKLNERQKQDLVIISVSFDPEVDTPEVMKLYATREGFDVPGWQFLTGTETQIRQVTANYGVWYERVEDKHTDNVSDGHVHRFSHNLVTILIDRDGAVRKAYGHAFFTEAEMIANITSLLN